MRRIKFRKQWGSHLPVLIAVTSRTSGLILELGSGLYSTPYLHWECYRTGRTLITYESVKQYYDIAAQYNYGRHKVIFVDDWDAVNFSEHCEVAFVDHHPGERRGKDIMRLAYADYVIAHDAMKRYEESYGLAKAFAQFKYKYRYKRAVPYTMVLSNKHYLSDFRVSP